MELKYWISGPDGVYVSHNGVILADLPEEQRLEGNEVEVKSILDKFHKLGYTKLRLDTKVNCVDCRYSGSLENEFSQKYLSFHKCPKCLSRRISLVKYKEVQPT